MLMKINKDSCVACGNCIGVCPSSAIEFSGSSIIINEEVCFGCGICEDICPVEAIYEVDE